MARKTNDMGDADIMERDDATQPFFEEGPAGMFDVGYKEGDVIPDEGETIDLRSNAPRVPKPTNRSRGSNKPTAYVSDGAGRVGSKPSEPTKAVVTDRKIREILGDLPEGITIVSGAPVLKTKPGKALTEEDLAQQAADLRQVRADIKKATGQIERSAKADAAKKEKEKQKTIDDAAKAKADKEAKAKADKEAKEKLKGEETALVPLTAADAVLDFSILKRAGIVGGPMGLTIPETLSVNLWKQALEHQVLEAKRSPWYIGDLLAFGVDHYGKMYANTLATFGYEAGTLRNYMSVAKLYPAEVRVEGLDYLHHANAASLYRRDPATAMNILQNALHGEWPATQVAEAVKQYAIAKNRGNGVEPPAPRPSGTHEARDERAAERRNGAEQVPYEVELHQLAEDEIMSFENAVLNNDDISERNRNELATFIEICKTEQTVSTGMALRTMARLQIDVERERARADSLMVQVDQLQRQLEKLGAAA